MCLESLEDLGVRPLNLSIAAGMRNGGETHLCAQLVAVLQERLAGELRPIVGNDLAGHPEAAHNPLDEGDGCLGCDAAHQLHLRPFGEFVDGYEEE